MDRKRISSLRDPVQDGRIVAKNEKEEEAANFGSYNVSFKSPDKLRGIKPRYLGEFVVFDHTIPSAVA